MRKTKIMVVENEVIVAADLQDCLTRSGYHISALAKSAEEALRKAGETRPNLVLMDICLNGSLDGIQAADHLQEQFDIPVVFLTAHADEPTLQRAKASAPFGYVLKPYDERELHTAIEIALYRHQTEARIKQVEAWLAAVLESIGDAVVATDKWGLITFINAAAVALSGWDSNQAVAKPLTDVFPLLDASTRRPVASPVSKVVFEDAVLNWRTPLLLLARDNSETLVEYTAAPIRDQQHNTTGIVWVFRIVATPQWLEAERAQPLRRP